VVARVHFASLVSASQNRGGGNAGVASLPGLDLHKFGEHLASLVGGETGHGLPLGFVSAILGVGRFRVSTRLPRVGTLMMRLSIGNTPATAGVIFSARLRRLPLKAVRASVTLPLALLRTRPRAPSRR
jgi:hypothetical protein